jgi:hypothetical protein
MKNTVKPKTTPKNTEQNNSKAVSIAMHHFTINPQNKTSEKNQSPKIKLSEGFKEKWVQKIRAEAKQEARNQYNYRAGLIPIVIAQALRIVGVEHCRILDMARGRFITQSRFLPKEFVNQHATHFSPLVQKMREFEYRGMSPKWIASYIERNM